MFQSSPSPETGRDVVEDLDCLPAGLMFQSSPSPETGHDAALALWVILETGVSILAQSGDWARPWRAMELAIEEREFQSSPSPETGRDKEQLMRIPRILKFQSSPSPETGRDGAF